VLNRSAVHVGWFSLGSFGLASMMVINILLLQRLLQADFTKDHGLRNNSRVESINHYETSIENSKDHTS